MDRKIRALIEESVEKARVLLGGRADLVKLFPPDPFGKGVPTLANGVYRDFTRQLKERYEMFGRWEWATHGVWLGLQDMEALWGDVASDETLRRIKGLRAGSDEGLPNGAASLFRPERLSLFAASDLDYQAVFLLWLDFEDEPEFWVYDGNGESRYKDLAEYLKAYLEDDVSAMDRRWKLAETERLGPLR